MKFILICAISAIALALGVSSPGFALAGDVAASSDSSPKGGKQQQGAGQKKKKKKKKKKPHNGEQSNEPAPLDEIDDDMDQVVDDIKYHHGTLFFDDAVQHRDYGFELSLGVSVAKVQETSARLDNVGVALIVDHDLVLGASATRQAAPVVHTVAGADFESSLLYYGVEWAWIEGWDEIANVRYQLFAGAGSLHVETESGESDDFRTCVLEPLWGLYFNVVPWLRLGFDASYRFVVVNEPGIRGESYSGYSVGLSLRGGSL